MERKRHYRTPRSRLERVGIETGLLNKNGDYIVTGDYIRLEGPEGYSGIVLYNRHQKCYGIFMGNYDKRDKYDPDSYGKFIRIPDDQGMRMLLIPIDEV